MLNEKLATIVYWHGLCKEVGIALASQELCLTLIPVKFTAKITLVYWWIWVNMTDGYFLFIYLFLFAIMTLKYNKNKKIQKVTKRERE